MTSYISILRWCPSNTQIHTQHTHTHRSSTHTHTHTWSVRRSTCCKRCSATRPWCPTCPWGWACLCSSASPICTASGVCACVCVCVTVCVRARAPCKLVVAPGFMRVALGHSLGVVWLARVAACCSRAPHQVRLFGALYKPGVKPGGRLGFKPGRRAQQDCAPLTTGECQCGCQCFRFANAKGP